MPPPSTNNQIDSTQRSSSEASASPTSASGSEGGTTVAGASGSGGTASPSGAPRKRRRGGRGRGGRGRQPGSGGQGGASSGHGVAVAGTSSGGDSVADDDFDDDDAGDDDTLDTHGVVRVTVSSDSRFPELPDPPGEGVASPDRVGDAEVHVRRPNQPMERPRIGDTRAPVTASPSASSGTSAEATEAGAAPRKKRRRRGGRGRGKVSTSSAGPVTYSMEADDDSPIELDEETIEARKGRERKGRPVGRYTMAVHHHPEVTQIAVLEGRSLVEHYVSHPADDVWQIDGNIYIGRVQNVLPGMEAAFVDIGTPKNAVLYRGDIRYDVSETDSTSATSSKNANVKIEEMLRNGQTVLCQVTKNPIGAKGARLTQEVSLPGRFVVFIPNSDTYGISKRLPDDERKRLRRILDDVRPAGHGLIVRTAAEGATAEELRRDVQRLAGQWAAIEKQVASAKAPKLLYTEPQAALRIIREEFNKSYRAVVIDDHALFLEVRDYVASISPELADRIEWHDVEAQALPLFEQYHVHEQLHRALDRKVWLPSGGSLIIERTEALTVIDVNTGKNVGTSSLEETVYKNNLEAADEIARQLRLRDIGGIIVVDFIDMEIMNHRRQLVDRFRDALARDKTRTQVFDVSELGLVEMTRKRVNEGLVESFSSTCPTCEGRGFTIDEALLND